MASDEHVIGPVAARLSDAQIDLLRRHGQERATTQGEVLFREGDRGYDFLVILAGTVVVLDGYGGAERELAVGFPGDFVAELNLLTGERLYTTAGDPRAWGGAGRTGRRAHPADRRAPRPR
jgi:CRP-like cAMP-binding protein